MSFYSKLRGTFESIFQIGKGGPNVKNNSGVIEFRNAADNAFALARALDPVGNNDLVTLGYFNTYNAAAQGLTYVKVTLAQSTVVTTGTIPDNAIIQDCVVDVTTAYDNNATIAVKRTGDATKTLSATADNDAATIGTYQVPQILSWGSTGAGTVTATITGSPTVGVAVVYIGYVTPTAL